MRAYPEKLPQLLNKGLAPLYLIYGDEPLQMREALDAVRQAAWAQGFDSREVLDAGADFNWDQLYAMADNLSLFSSRRLLDLRIPSGKPGAAGSQALRDYAQRPAEETVLLISSGKLDKNAVNSAWFKALDKLGVVVAVRDIPLPQLPDWLNRRLLGRGLQLPSEAVQLLVERVQGNLLAAMQEVEKLELLYGRGQVSTEQVAEAVTDSARFTLFALSEAVLAGSAERTLRIFSALRGEGTASNLILWLLNRELRLLAQLSFNGRRVTESDMRGVGIWSSQQGLYQRALRRINHAQALQLLQQCAEIERQLKGREVGDEWLALEQLSLKMAGLDPFARQSL